MRKEYMYFKRLDSGEFVLKSVNPEPHTPGEGDGVSLPVDLPTFITSLGCEDVFASHERASSRQEALATNTTSFGRRPTEDNSRASMLPKPSSLLLDPGRRRRDGRQYKSILELQRERAETRMKKHQEAAHQTMEALRRYREKRAGAKGTTTGASSSSTLDSPSKTGDGDTGTAKISQAADTRQGDPTSRKDANGETTDGGRSVNQTKEKPTMDIPSRNADRKDVSATGARKTSSKDHVATAENAAAGRPMENTTSNAATSNPTHPGRSGGRAEKTTSSTPWRMSNHGSLAGQGGGGRVSRVYSSITARHTGCVDARRLMEKMEAFKQSERITPFGESLVSVPMPCPLVAKAARRVLSEKYGRPHPGPHPRAKRQGRGGSPRVSAKKSKAVSLLASQSANSNAVGANRESSATQRKPSHASAASRSTRHATTPKSTPGHATTASRTPGHVGEKGREGKAAKGLRQSAQSPGPPTARGKARASIKTHFLPQSPSGPLLVNCDTSPRKTVQEYFNLFGAPRTNSNPSMAKTGAASSKSSRLGSAASTGKSDAVPDRVMGLGFSAPASPRQRKAGATVGFLPSEPGTSLGRTSAPAPSGVGKDRERTEVSRAEPSKQTRRLATFEDGISSTSTDATTDSDSYTPRVLIGIKVDSGMPKAAWVRTSGRTSDSGSTDSISTSVSRAEALCSSGNAQTFSSASNAAHTEYSSTSSSLSSSSSMSSSPIVKPGQTNTPTNPTNTRSDGAKMEPAQDAKKLGTQRVSDSSSESAVHSRKNTRGEKKVSFSPSTIETDKKTRTTRNKRLRPHLEPSTFSLLTLTPKSANFSRAYTCHIPRGQNPRPGGAARHAGTLPMADTGSGSGGSRPGLAQSAFSFSGRGGTMRRVWDLFST